MGTPRDLGTNNSLD